MFFAWSVALDKSVRVSGSPFIFFLSLIHIWNFPLTELTEQQHREALENGFGKQVVQGYSHVIAALKQGYASLAVSYTHLLFADFLHFAFYHHDVVICGGNHQRCV